MEKDIEQGVDNLYKCLGFKSCINNTGGESWLENYFVRMLWFECFNEGRGEGRLHFLSF